MSVTINKLAGYAQSAQIPIPAQETTLMIIQCHGCKGHVIISNQSASVTVTARLYSIITTQSGVSVKSQIGSDITIAPNSKSKPLIWLGEYQQIEVCVVGTTSSTDTVSGYAYVSY